EPQFDTMFQPGTLVPVRRGASRRNRMKLSALFALPMVAGLVLAPAAAFAAPGIANVAANVRSGPGTGYRVVDTLERGEYVIVKSCDRSWCLISHIGPDGYVSRS